MERVSANGRRARPVDGPTRTVTSSLDEDGHAAGTYVGGVRLQVPLATFLRARWRRRGMGAEADVHVPVVPATCGPEPVAQRGDVEGRRQAAPVVGVVGPRRLFEPERRDRALSLIHISEPTRRTPI